MAKVIQKIKNELHPSGAMTVHADGPTFVRNDYNNNTIVVSVNSVQTIFSAREAYNVSLALQDAVKRSTGE